MACSHGLAEGGREAELFEADVARMHLGDGAAGNQQVDIQGGKEREQAQVPAACVGQRREERDRLPAEEDAADREPRPALDERGGVVERDHFGSRHSPVLPNVRPLD